MGCEKLRAIKITIRIFMVPFLPIYFATKRMYITDLIPFDLLQSFPKETQLFSVDFSWGPGSGSCNLGSLVYTLLQKKGNFRNVAFLLEKSVGLCTCSLYSTGYCPSINWVNVRVNIKDQGRIWHAMLYSTGHFL